MPFPFSRFLSILLLSETQQLSKLQLLLAPILINKELKEVSKSDSMPDQ